ncbi:hypothetical protein SAMN05444156_1037 [Verrucomicrobium sp. GAS474]|uniref:hypothetical protein n=1 Tax=Verrucomicrobium sp. GAS474 TaxID=1882831 RepID=UPI0008797491|nr:hypothetical protein [Verrucomicrobium sp. GAS474]SDT95468.1 hypothetical protein SAMN05444156_1037 [Verrucomicrobium sp. GAS474]
MKTPNRLPAAPAPPPLTFGEIARTMDDVRAADNVMAEIVRDIDEIAFQADIIALRGQVATEVRDLQSQANELRDMAGKLGCLVGSLIDAELRRSPGSGSGRPSLARHLARPPAPRRHADPA